MNSNELMIWASGHFLTENYPENWASMSERDINSFIVDHAIEPFEGHDPEEVMQFIIMVIQYAV